MKYNDSYSVWRLPCAKRYYLTHPWKWVKDIKRNIADTYRRAKYGWTWVDVWNFDSWFLTIAPDMLRHMADKGSAYPGREPFETPEQWHDWLYEMAGLLETGREDWQDKHNEYYKEYMDHIMDDWEPPIKDKSGFYHSKPKEQTELQKKYFARAAELAEEGQKNVERALTSMAPHFHCLWD